MSGLTYLVLAGGIVGVVLFVCGYIGFGKPQPTTAEQWQRLIPRKQG